MAQASLSLSVGHDIVFNVYYFIGCPRRDFLMFIIWCLNLTFFFFVSSHLVFYPWSCSGVFYIAICFVQFCWSTWTFLFCPVTSLRYITALSILLQYCVVYLLSITINSAISYLLVSITLPYAAVLPDFAQVYSFIGSVFDPNVTGHLQKLKKMDPIDIETVCSKF